MLSATCVVLGVAGSAVWIAFFVAAGMNRKWLKSLPELPDERPPGGWPRLALVVAARDEEAEVEAAVRSMLASDYPELRVVAVDDRSADATGAILDRSAAEDPRLSVVHVTELPDGWLGKTHAQQQGAARAEADWLLFTDADVRLAPGALRRAMAFALRSGADHVTVAPGIPTATLGERLFLAMFQAGMTLAAPGWRVEDARRRESLGIGAFNLVRAEAFAPLGGFERLRLSIDDDLQLGRALKWSGRRTRVLIGHEDVSVRWHVGLPNLVRGLEKNFFAAARFRLGLVAIGALAIVTLGVGPFLGLLAGPAWSRGVSAAGLAVMAVLLHLMGRSSGIRWYHAALMPVGAVAVLVALLRSTWLTLARRGVRWRGHLYALADLKDHVRRRERWLRELWLSTR